ncbi:dehydrogenase/reductase SDR family member 4-like [Ambystoma mexicanum]|uniref:dehydrogenase/reductase SDR family member 4-like n=1 Tax=Ambystoma mexicanum TaxID=8296 RepID=UPI0037E94C1F
MRNCSMLHSLVRCHGFLRLSMLARRPCSSRMSSGTAERSKIHAGKVAVTTASTTGIGFAVARRLAQEGAHVVLSSRNQKNVNKAVDQLKSENLTVSGIACDAGKKEDQQRLLDMALDTYGGIDYLFSHAASEAISKNVFETTEEEWDMIMNLNVKSAFLLVKQVFPHMEKRGGGSIVLTSSVLGFSSLATCGPYSVSKTAINGLTKVLAPALSPMNIRLNTLAPGFIRTGFSSRGLEAGAMHLNEEQRSSGLKEDWDAERVLKYTMETCGISRAGEPEECAGMVSFLLSSDASYITGEIMVVGGGYRTRI